MGCTRWGGNRKWLYISPFDASDRARLGLFPSPDGIAGMYQSFPITFRHRAHFTLILKRSSPAHAQTPSTSGSKLLLPAAGPDHAGEWRPEWPAPGLGVQFLFLHVHCDGLNCVPEKRYVEVLTPPPSVALFESKIFTEAIQLK